ncbi:hypothetical protein ACOSQ2_024128 [Xanthoceras sorbifolium]
MSCSLRGVVSVSVSGFNETEGIVVGSSQFRKSKSNNLSVLRLDFKGQPLVVSDHKDLRDWSTVKAPNKLFIHAQASICVSRALRWWEKTIKPNMLEIHSAQELVDSLINGGDRLVIVDFYSPGCGGCRALHPKICQLAELNPNAIFLKVNYEELRTTCHSLHIHVLPFFRFYRGAEGHLCSFSCTNSTIKKFKDALAKHGADRCSIGPTKGLDESELLKLGSLGELPIDLPLPSTKEERVEDLLIKCIDFSGLVLSKSSGNKMEFKEETALL